MTDTAIVPRKPERLRPGRPPLVGDELTEQLLGKAQAGEWSCSALMDSVPGDEGDAGAALAEEMTSQLDYDSTTRPRAAAATTATAARRRRY